MVNEQKRILGLTSEHRMMGMVKALVVACGKARLYVRGAGSEYVWDIAPVELLIREAGGMVTNIDGKFLAFGENGRVQGTERHSVFTSNGPRWHRLACEAVEKTGPCGRARREAGNSRIRAVGQRRHGRAVIEKVVGENGGVIEYYNEMGGRGENWIAFVRLEGGNSKDLTAALTAYGGVSVLEMPDNQKLVFPKWDFGKDLTPEEMRVGDMIPEISSDSLIYSFKSEADRDLLFKVFESFRERRDWTHFVCFPMSPVFPELKESLDRMLRQWGIREDKLKINNIFHLTLILFVLKDESEIAKMCELVGESMKEVEWPSDLTLTFPKLGYFGRSPKRARILFARPSGQFIAALERFRDILAEKARTAGFTRLELITEMHATVVRPNCMNKWARDFDCRKMMEEYEATPLSPITANEIRLVRRFVFDEDLFYHTEGRFYVTEINP
jgi:2'-5' RNA ligase